MVHLLIRCDPSSAYYSEELAGQRPSPRGRCAGPLLGVDVPESVLTAGFAAAGYQWYRDGAPLPGETDSELTLSGVGAADYGHYQCTGEGGELSRSIVVAESILHGDPLFGDGLNTSTVEFAHAN